MSLLKYYKKSDSKNPLEFSYNGNTYNLSSYTIGFYGNLLTRYDSKEISKIFKHVSDTISNYFGHGIYSQFIINFLNSDNGSKISKIYLNNKTNDFEMIDKQLIIDLFKTYIQDKYKTDATNSIEILANKLRSILFTDAINKLLESVKDEVLQNMLIEQSENFNFDELIKYLSEMDSTMLHYFTSIVNKYE